MSKLLCQSCEDDITEVRIAAFLKNWGRLPEYCIRCQSLRDENGLDGHLLPTEAIASNSEGDDETRSRELGWGQLTIKRRLVRVTA